MSTPVWFFLFFGYDRIKYNYYFKRIMLKEYSKEELWKLYETLPPELKETIFSEETAEDISRICEKNEVVEGDKTSEVAKYVGRVLMGVLPSEEFQKTLETELNLTKDVAKKVSEEIDRVIFYPVKSSLEKLYKTGPVPSSIETPISPSDVVPAKEKKRVSKKDTYREVVE
jgi:hypothetical protein